jgi:Tfp pilus assembly protein PilF
MSSQNVAEAPTTVEPLLALSSLHVEAGRLHQALPLILRAQDLAPEAIGPKLALADLLAEQGDNQEARTLYEGIWRKSSKAAHHYGRFLDALGDHALARNALDRAEVDVLYPERYHVLLLRSEIAQSQGDFAAALADLEKARRMNGEDPAVTLQLIRLQIARGDYADAIALFADLEARRIEHPLVPAVGLEISALKARLAIMQPRFGS